MVEDGEELRRQRCKTSIFVALLVFESGVEAANLSFYVLIEGVKTAV